MRVCIASDTDEDMSMFPKFTPTPGDVVVHARRRHEAQDWLDSEAGKKWREATKALQERCS